MDNEYKYYDVILNPVVTEKATGERMQYNKYVFHVDLKSNKKQIKDAIEHLFKVTVVSVNTQSLIGKPRRLGKYLGKTSKKKKAIVTLKEGDRIKLIEGP